MAARPSPPLSIGGAGPRAACWAWVRSSRRLRARAPALVALLRRARPARLQSRLCPRMGWGSWEERAGARAGRDPPQPESAPVVWVQRADCRSADAPRSHGLAGTDASRPGTGEKEVQIRESSAPLPHPIALRPVGPLRPPTPYPRERTGREVLGLHSNPHGIGAWERSGASRIKQ